MFGEDWEKVHLTAARRAVAQKIIQGQLPLAAFGIIAARICKEAQSNGREDVLNFMRENFIGSEKDLKKLGK